MVFSRRSCARVFPGRAGDDDAVAVVRYGLTDGRCRRIDCTRGSPGSVAFSNSTAASAASPAGAPTIHFRYTSATRALCPATLLTGRAHRLGNPFRVVTAEEPV